MKYTIGITEILQKQVEIEADNEEQAYNLAKDMYCNGQIILDFSNFSQTSFNRLYDLDGNKYTIEELREGYRVITGLDNDKDFTDEEIYKYILEETEEE